MESDVGRYERLFDHVRAMRRKLEGSGKQRMLDDYLRYMFLSRDLDYGMRLDDVILEASHDLLHKCVAIVRGYKLGNDTWFTRMARAYIKAHPMDFAETTCCLIYSWMLFPHYFHYLTEEQNGDALYKILYGRQYRELCKLVDKCEVDRLVELFDEAFLLRGAKDVELRAGRDQMMTVLMEYLEDENCYLWQLFLERPELLDYQWLRTYQKEKGQGE